jgi:hypothetical protein
MAMAESLKASVSNPLTSKTMFGLAETCISYGGKRTGVYFACLQLFPWVESGGITSHCPPQFIIKVYHPLPGSAANAVTVMPYTVASDCL